MMPGAWVEISVFAASVYATTPRSNQREAPGTLSSRVLISPPAEVSTTANVEPRATSISPIAAASASCS